jgi:hypothetical protein
MPCKIKPVLLSAIALTLFATPDSSRPVASESEVKAGFVYQFARFTEWPVQRATAHKTFAACVVGSDALSPVLRTVLAGKALGGRPISFRDQVGEREARDCDLIFVAASERKRFPIILDALASSPALTVGDWPQFAGDGGIIGFYTDEDRVRFEVNVAAARKAGLIISSQMLKLARIVGAKT